MKRARGAGKRDSAAALLVIDVQLGMFESPLIPPVHDAARLLSVISSAIARAREAGVRVIYVQHCGGKGHPLQEGTPQWRIHPAVLPHNGEPIVPKRFSDSFQETGLHELLQSASVRRLFITGIQTDFCVDTACRRAFSLGYDVALIEDGHGTWGNGVLDPEQIIAHHNRTLGSSFVKLVRADALFQDSQVTAKT